MTKRPFEMHRRTVLRGAAGFAVGQLALQTACASAPPSAGMAGGPPGAGAGGAGAGAGTGTGTGAGGSKLASPPPGRPGDFDFLAGSWKISHRRLKEPGADWDVFEGEATCWTILGGIGSIEELRIPARNFSGLGLRLLDVERHLWSDFWVNARSGVLTTPGVTGGFHEGVGTFTSEEMEGDQRILARGVWDRITPTSCRWHQSTSRDGGVSFTPNWFMDWVRV